ncbi:MAG: Npt1/Npt2 family nucleotide transporter [Rickettsiaceae bacterium]|nr:Npt1/Npt2 family nucleotide transporter [Rickettsiaceae bacterium]
MQDAATKSSSLDNLRKIIWPIERGEIKKFLPMAMMMFLILFNYSMLRSIKDGFVVTHIGPEALSFLKLYVVLPSAIIAMIIYAKLCNIMSQASVFYTIVGFFATYLSIFAYFLYPDPDSYHPHAHQIEELVELYPSLKWFIKIIGKWTYASFYTIAELWGSIITSLLFWQFANQITKTNEAKRFYSMFGLLGNFGLILTGYVLGTSLGEDAADSSKNMGFEFVLSISVVATILLGIVYWWMQTYVLTDPKYYNPEEGKSGGGKKKKAKLGLYDSAKLIFSSRYLGYIAVLVFAYGVSINLVEGVWKAKIKLLYPTAESYTAFMGQFQFWQGIGAILFMLIGSNILRYFSWRVAAQLTPIMVLVTGIAFFMFVIFDQQISLLAAGLITSSPLVLGVTIGTIQNVLSKSVKYSLFDSTKEMAYIPLDDELKTKGKAAVDVVGGRLGKSGGGFIQSTTFMLFGVDFATATPYFGGIFVLIVIMWIYAVEGLNKEYKKITDEK